MLDGPTLDPARSSFSPDGKLAAKPLFRDPVFDAATDPVVIWNPNVERWWMLYSSRRATLREMGRPFAWLVWVRIHSGPPLVCQG